MTNNKRKLSDISDIISGDLKKKLKSAYTESEDSNALILKKSNKPKGSKQKPVEEPKILSNKKRKNLEKIEKSKQEKLNFNDVCEELKKYYQLKPEEAITSLKEDLKKNPVNVRTTLSTKVKPVSKRKYKAWEKQKTKPLGIKIKSSPDTSDISSDDENEDGITEHINVDTSQTCQTTKMCNESTVENDIIIPDSLQTNTLKVESKVLPAKPVPKSYIDVKRPKEVQAARLSLPILFEESTIMEAINENDIIIISGETGCGKTTQVPQFLYEAGFTMDGHKIGVTEPRRIAAISVSERVKYELSCQNSSVVAYHVRYDNKSNIATQIKFMTDGILLQEMIKNGNLLLNYSAIIIDEAHERSVFTDILIGCLSVIVRARRKAFEKLRLNPPKDGLPPRPLKLIIMSATLRVADFAENKRLFPGDIRPPVIKIDTRQFPVQVSFSKHTRSNYLEEAFKKICKVHNESIDGGILVFVTGQQDCLTLCKWIRKAFPVTHRFLKNLKNQSTTERISTNKFRALNKSCENEKEPENIKVNLTDFSIIPNDEEAEISQIDNENVSSEKEDDTDSDEDDAINIDITGGYTNNDCVNPAYALPLFSLLDKEKQDLVFQPAPPGQRMIVVATNVAETSLTIPNIKYVIDTGLEKVKKWDKVTGMSKFQLERISQSSANQRTGRAGRTGPGQCFRLYSSAVFEEMKAFSTPEIELRPVEDVVLQLRNFFPSWIPIGECCLPSVPSQLAIDRAEKQLILMGALNKIKIGSQVRTEITDIGQSMIKIPLSPRFAGMIMSSNQQNLLAYSVLMASLLSVQDFFSNNIASLSSDDISEANAVAASFKRESIKKKADLMLGDITVLLASFCKLESYCLKSEADAKRLAELGGVRWKAFCEVRKLRQQLTDILTSNVKDLDLAVYALPRPTEKQFEHLRQLILSGSPNNVAVMAPPNFSISKTPQERRKNKGMYLSCSVEQPVFIQSQSVLCRERFQWIVYQDLYESVSFGESNAKPFMRNISVIEPEWLPLSCTRNCQAEGLYLDNKSPEDKKPIYDENLDKIMAHAKKIFYGDRRLELPPGIRIPVIYEIMENEELQGNLLRRWFAKFFLDGVLFKSMEPWKLKMKSACNPELVLAPFANSRPEIMLLMIEINKLKFPSRQAICDEWKKNHTYLRNAYLEWIKTDERETVSIAWPPVDMQ